MPPHPLIRRVARWGGAIASLLLAAVWIGSGWVWISRYSPSGGCGWTIAGGEVYACWDGRSDGPWAWSDSPHVNIAVGQLAWNSPALNLDPWNRSILVPLWLPLVFAAALTAFAWWPPGPRDGCCPSCSYSRAGLPPSTPCPECGRGPA